MAAVASVILQLFATRVLGAELAGMFAIAITTGLLCYHIGSMNMRSFQCTDLKREHSFSSYLTVKLLACAAMLLCAGAYVLLRGYSGVARNSACCFAPTRQWRLFPIASGGYSTSAADSS